MGATESPFLSKVAVIIPWMSINCMFFRVFLVEVIHPRHSLQGMGAASRKGGEVEASQPRLELFDECLEMDGELDVLDDDLMHVACVGTRCTRMPTLRCR